jgi:hypothetical protein
MVIWRLTITLDGFIAGPRHDVSFLGGVEHTPDVRRAVRRDPGGPSLV